MRRMIGSFPSIVLRLHFVQCSTQGQARTLLPLLHSTLLLELMGYKKITPAYFFAFSFASHYNQSLSSSSTHIAGDCCAIAEIAIQDLQPPSTTLNHLIIHTTTYHQQSHPIIKMSKSTNDEHMALRKYPPPSTPTISLPFHHHTNPTHQS